MYKYTGGVVCKLLYPTTGTITLSLESYCSLGWYMDVVHSTSMVGMTGGHGMNTKDEHT